MMKLKCGNYIKQTFPALKNDDLLMIEVDAIYPFLLWVTFCPGCMFLFKYLVRTSNRCLWVFSPSLKRWGQASYFVILLFGQRWDQVKAQIKTGRS